MFKRCLHSFFACAVVFFVAPPIQAQGPAITGASAPRPTRSNPIVIDWLPGVGEPGQSTPSEQALHEAVARHVYVRRIKGDTASHRIAWHIRAAADDAYPATPSLFGSSTYPSGVVLLPTTMQQADIVIRTYPTDRPDWARSFEVVLTDAVTAQPIVSAGGRPVVVGFSVAGDLTCKVGRADRCGTSTRLAAGIPEIGDLQQAQLLAAFCTPTAINGNTCSRVPRYPKGAQCEVELSGKVYTGRFVKAHARMIIADYRSACESHAENFGGIAVFDEIDNRIRLQGFVPGLGATDCVVIGRGGKRDRLLCISKFNGGGHETSGLFEQRFDRSSAGHYTVTANHLFEAQDNQGAYGLTEVSCESRSEDLDIIAISAGSAPDVVSITVSYLNQAVIKAACTLPQAGPNETFRPANPGYAFVKDGQAQRRSVLFNLADRSKVLRSHPSQPVK